MFEIEKIDRRVELFAFDVYVAILKIEHVSKEFSTVQELLYDFRSWDSVIREFEIIGEASKYLLKDQLIENNYRRIVDFRNQITHEHFGIDQDIVWSIIHQKLDLLKKDIITLIDSIDDALKTELIESFIEDNKYLDFVVYALTELE
jgi:uncharacterized protein with HEPN domain